MPFGIGTYSGGFPRQDFVMLGGKKTPGKCEIVGAGTPRTWDVRQGYGFSGAYVVFTGAGLAKFDIIVTLWEESDFDDWDDFADVLLLPPKSSTSLLGAGVPSIGSPKPRALVISHPLLVVKPLNITSVVIEDVLQPMQSEFGDYDIVIKCVEFRQPLQMLGRPNQAIPAPPTTALEPADTVKKRQIAALLKQHEDLAQ